LFPRKKKEKERKKKMRKGHVCSVVWREKEVEGPGQNEVALAAVPERKGGGREGEGPILAYFP